MPHLEGRYRVVGVLAAAVALGFSAALIKGQDDGLRYALGNLSAPWLLVAFWCGSVVRSRAAGAFAGIIGTALALAGFCLGLALISDYDTSSAVTAIHFAFRANTRYFEAGIFSGAVFGCIGAAWTRREGSRTLLAGVLLLSEPIVNLLARKFSASGGVDGVWSGLRSTAYLIEGLCGLLTVLAVIIRSRNHATPES